jgi:hypothetical protein
MRSLTRVAVIVLAVLGLIWLVRTCQRESGGSPLDTVTDTAEEAVDEVGDAVRDIGN